MYKKTILILANNDAGLYKFRKELLESLIKNYRVVISLPDGPFVAQLKELGCEFVDTSFERRGKNLKKEIGLLLFYKTLLKKIRPDLILTYTIKPTLYGGMIARSLKIPYIVNITGLGSTMQHQGSLQKGLLFLYKLVLPHAVCVFFQNNTNREFFAQKKMLKRSALIPGSGVNVEEYLEEEYPKFKFGEDKFLFVGRLMEDKGVIELFEAAEKLKEHYKNISFDIVGRADEDFSEELSALEKKEIVTYWGEQKNVKSFLKQCSAIVLPSYHEGMANVLLEASSCGRPVLASDIPGCRETFDEGISGFGFKAKDPVSLYKILERFIQLDYSKKVEMGKAARKKMEDEFDRRKVIEAYESEIERFFES